MVCVSVCWEGVWGGSGEVGDADVCVWGGEVSPKPSTIAEALSILTGTIWGFWSRSLCAEVGTPLSSLLSYPLRQ